MEPEQKSNTEQQRITEFQTTQRPIEEAEAIAGDDTNEYGIIDPETGWDSTPQQTVDIAVTQINYTIAGNNSDERPVIHIFGRTADNDVEHIRVHGFRPYFYAPIEDVDKEILTEIDRITDWETTDQNGNPYKSIRGKRLMKIFGQTPRDVGQVRDRFEHYEADVLFPNRFLIDKNIKSGVRVPERRVNGEVIDVSPDEVTPAEVKTDVRTCIFDIEVDDRQGFPEDGEEQIICLTSYDSYDEEYIAWLTSPRDGLGQEISELTNYERLNNDATIKIQTFDTEEAMLAAFLDYTADRDFDLLTGWNFTDFDAPYLLDRLERLESTDHNLDPERLSRVNEVWRSDWQGPNVKGRVVFDLLYAYQRTQFSELDSYRLDAVAEQELGVGKERYTGDLGDLWEDNPERLLEYNVRDVELCVELNEKQEIIPFWQEVASFVGCKLEDATTPGDAVDMYVMHKAHDKFVLPSKGYQESEDFEGGAVFEPISGVREMVPVLDLASLYPNAMVTINASPETKVPNDYEGETHVAPNGQRFRKEPDGIMREMVDELLKEREEKKSLRDQHDPDESEYERYDRQQAAVKVIMNSLYGVSGWDRFRLYDKENAAAVTATGREVIRFTAEAASDEGHEVIYGDTDSVLLEFGSGVSKEDAIEQSFDIATHINNRYDEFASEQLNADEHRFQIEFEKLYRRFFQAGKKKRYAGNIIWKEGKDVDDLDITGFEYKRSDIAPITKQVQQTVLEKIVRGEDIEDIESYVHDVIEEFRSGELPIDDVGIPGGIGKQLDEYDTSTAHVRGAKYANCILGTNFNRGSKPKRLYLERVHPVFFERIEREEEAIKQDSVYREFKRNPDVICFEYVDQLPDEFVVDWDVMLDKTLKGPIARIIEALDSSWEKVEEGSEQPGLDQYM